MSWNLRERCAHLVVSCGGIGSIPFAPGTWGSVPGLFCAYVIQSTKPQDVMLAWIWIIAWSSLLSFVAWFAIREAERLTKQHDLASTVIDEVAGMNWSVVFFAFDPLVYLLGFVLFRILDIRKPWLIGWLDRELKGAWGTLADDLLAGFMVAGILAILTYWVG